jgi:ABC-2 type transport system permease protein
VVAVFSIVATMLITLTALSAGGLLLGFKVPFAERLAGVSGTGDAIWRLAQATAYVAWSMSSMIALAFMVSTMTDAATGAVGAGVGLGVVSQILDAIPALGRLRGGLPTHHLEAWTHLFSPFDSRGDVIRGLVLPVPYLAVFLGTALWWFRRKDVLS